MGVAGKKMDYSEFIKKFYMRVNDDQMYSKDMRTPSGYERRVRDFVHDINEKSKENARKTGRNRTEIIETNYGISIDAFRERMAAEFKITKIIRFHFMYIKVSIRYPFSDSGAVRILERLDYLLSYRAVTKRRYYPTIIPRKTVTDNYKEQLIYFDIFLPLYDFYNHKPLDKVETRDIIDFIQNSIISIVRDPNYCSELEYDILNEVYDDARANAIKNHRMVKEEDKYYKSKR